MSEVTYHGLTEAEKALDALYEALNEYQDVCSEGISVKVHEEFNKALDIPAVVALTEQIRNVIDAADADADVGP
jgi:hypothetical protein